MKRKLSLWLALLVFAALPAIAQAPALTNDGKIKGHVTNPTGAPTTAGNVSLSTDGGHTSKYTFQLNANGDYEGTAAPGTYLVIFRAPDTPPDKVVDQFDNVKVVTGQETIQDIDMSRKAFIDKLSPEQQKQLEELRKKNSEAMKSNEVIKSLNADLRISTQDIKDADAAKATAAQQLGAGASATDVAAKEAEIKAQKYGEIETLMLKDTVAKPDASVLWAQLGQAEVGLKKYDDAIPNLKKAIDLEANSKKPNIAVQGLASSELGEIYARQGKVPEANAAYADAAKANPTQALVYFKNEAVIFSQVGNADAQVAAAQEAIKIDPNQALFYYLVGQGLVGKATMGPDPNNPKVQRIILPPGCAEAYQKYLELAPTGAYAADVKGILQQAGTTVSSSYKAGKKS